MLPPPLARSRTFHHPKEAPTPLAASPHASPSPWQPLLRFLSVGLLLWTCHTHRITRRVVTRVWLLWVGLRPRVHPRWGAVSTSLLWRLSNTPGRRRAACVCLAPRGWAPGFLRFGAVLAGAAVSSGHRVWRRHLSSLLVCPSLGQVAGSDGDSMFHLLRTCQALPQPRSLFTFFRARQAGPRSTPSPTCARFCL